MVWILAVLGWWLIPLGLVGSWAIWTIASRGVFASDRERDDWLQASFLGGAVLLALLVIALLQAS